MEHRRVGLVVVGTIHATRANNPDRRADLFHRADLNRRGVGAQHMRRAVIAFGTVGIEGVHLRTCRVVARNVQRVKVIPVGLDLRAFGNRKAHVCENRRYLFGNLRNRVDRALTTATTRQGHVEPLAAQTLF